MSDKIEITINGKKLSVSSKMTILQAAQQNGIYIPHLCYDRRLTPYGGCRLCLIEVEGLPKLLASCSTPVSKDMVIHTESEKLAKARKTVLELLLVHHPLDCPICDKAGECQLQDLAFKYGPTEGRFGAERKHAPERRAAPLIERNPNRCILCGLCVRICNEHQGVGAINLINRGFKTIVSPAFEETLDCEFCGQCIDVCPVGALGSKPYRFRSRVWFMDEKDTVCPYCGCGCTLSLGVREGKIVRSVGRDGKGISKGDLCGKGRFGFDFIYSESRLTTPLIRKDGALKPVSWEEALGYVGKRIQEVVKKHGPESFGAIGSQRCTVEDNFMFQRFMREAVGSNNIDSAARFGYAKAQEAIHKAFGLNRLPIRFDSPLDADAILVLSSDITSTHPVFGLNILRAVRDFDAKLIVADPKMTKLSRHATDWLRIMPGTSVSLVNGMMKVMIDEGLYDKSAEGLPEFNALKEGLSAYTPEAIEKSTGVSAQRIVDAARAFAGAKRKLICLTLTEAENTKGQDAVLAACNLALLTGAGHEGLQMPAEMSNTLGLYEAGVRPDAGPSHKKTGSRGIDAYSMFYSEKPSIKAMYIMGENPAVTFPRAGAVEEFLKGLDLLIVQDIFLNATAGMAHVVLPASSWAEKEGTFIGAAGEPQNLTRCVPETGDSVPDWMILRNLARHMHKDLGSGGFADLKAQAFKEIDLTKDNSPAYRFNPVCQSQDEQPDADFPFMLSIGVLMQHSGSLTAVSKSLGSVVSDAYVQVNDLDAQRLKLKDNAYVKLASRRGEIFLKAKITDEVPVGMVFVPGHFPHAKVNTLTYPPSNGSAPLVAVSVAPA